MSSVNDPADGCQVSWIIPNILMVPSFNLLAGASGVGKTAFLAGILRDIRLGHPVFGHSVTPPPEILLLCMDRRWEHGTKIWFERAGITDVRCYSFMGDRSASKSKLRERDKILDLFKRCLNHLLPITPGSLLIVDPISLFLAQRSMNDYIDSGAGCAEQNEIAEDYRVLILGTTHNSKQRGDAKTQHLRPQDRITGSMALWGFSETQMYLAGPEETRSPFYEFTWNPHYAPAETFRLTRDEHGLFIPIGDKIAPSDLLREAVLEFLALHRNYSNIMEQAEAWNTSRPSLERLLKSLMEEGEIVKLTRGLYVRVPHPRVH